MAEKSTAKRSGAAAGERIKTVKPMKVGKPRVKPIVVLPRVKPASANAGKLLRASVRNPTDAAGAVRALPAKETVKPKANISKNAAAARKASLHNASRVPPGTPPPARLEADRLTPNEGGSLTKAAMIAHETSVELAGDAAQEPTTSSRDHLPEVGGETKAASTSLLNGARLQDFAFGGFGAILMTSLAETSRQWTTFAERRLETNLLASTEFARSWALQAKLLTQTAQSMMGNSRPMTSAPRPPGRDDRQ